MSRLTLSWAVLRWRRAHWLLLIFLAMVSAVFYFALPDPLFENPYSMVLEDREGKLLSASIAADEQWRFPLQQSVPDKLATAITVFEDKRFFSHWGIDPWSVARAVRQNIKAGHVVSGASTLSMQVIRLARKSPSRTWLEKVIEALLALRLELRFSKAEILSLYAAHAPFGGNVVGLEAASWRYFGRSMEQVSWAEAALLAVLPNNPALMHPGKNREILRAKRNRLLERLAAIGFFDQVTLDLAKAEDLPQRPQPLPRLASHLLVRAAQGRHHTRIRSTLDKDLQEQVEIILQQHLPRIQANQVHNAAALIVKVNSGQVVAYAGNTMTGEQHHEEVDVIAAPRSTGSILKPFLYAAMMDEGKILPATLVPDVPTVMGGFSPKNFSKGYDGAVAANQALIRSLNIPAVYSLQDYRFEKFYTLLNDMGITTLHKPPGHYGLSLVLGGAEGTLWDITGAYASLARTLNRYFERPGSKRYSKSDIHPPYYELMAEKPMNESMATEAGPLSAASIWITLNTLTQVYRPGEEHGWRYFNSSKKIAWKTGTSFGYRDGWAIGVNPEYAVGVWVGNADGEGRPGLTGTEMAAPILFNLFSLLPGQSWFQRPTAEMALIPVCSHSGQRISPRCEKADTVWVNKAGLQSAPCTYHKTIHLSVRDNLQVTTACESMEHIVSRNWFVLPPVQEYYYRAKNLSYKPLPPFRAGCRSPAILPAMELIYPKPGAALYIPLELDGTHGQVVLQAAHQSAGAVIYWHLDGEYLASTKNKHSISLSPSAGTHTITLVDDQGIMLTQMFSVLSTP